MFDWLWSWSGRELRWCELYDRLTTLIKEQATKIEELEAYAALLEDQLKEKAAQE